MVAMLGRVPRAVGVGVAGLEEQRLACPAFLVQRALLLVARAAIWPKITLP